MPFVQVQKAPAVVLQKLSNLFYSLQHIKSHFEEAANSVKDKLVQRTLRGVAQESSQYANELCCKIQTMGGDPQQYFTMPDPLPAISQIPPEINSTSYDDDIMKACAADEAEMIKSYRDLLNDANLYTDLRSMIRYQLNGILYGYLQIKQLYN